MSFKSQTEQAKSFISPAVRAGGWVIDATIGNGNDTLFLAHLVGHSGKVFGFDIQESAINNTRKRIEQADTTDQVVLIHAGHEEMESQIPSTMKGLIQAVMFNLGYLPGSNKSCITQPNTTLTALKATESLLAPGGRITVLAYIGHEGGQAENEMVNDWVNSLDQQRWRCNCIYPENATNPPRLYCCEKLSNLHDKTFS